MNVSILYFEDHDLESIAKTAKQIQKELGKDTKLIVMPKNTQLLYDCSLEQLVYLMNSIQKIVESKSAEKSYGSTISC